MYCSLAQSWKLSNWVPNESVTYFCHRPEGAPHELEQVDIHFLTKMLVDDFELLRSHDLRTRKHMKNVWRCGGVNADPSSVFLCMRTLHTH